jgi:dimethylsulfone monooxygenase
MSSRLTPSAVAQPADETRQPMMLGIFATNGSGSAGISTVPTSYELSWGHSLKIAQMADEMGLDLFMPLSRWRGFGGETNYAGETYEPITYMTAIAASTRRIKTYVTLHLPIIHPVYAAKALATLDHVSRGRTGLNLVMGWFVRELGMFGIAPFSPDDRYAYGLEWLTIARRLWTEDVPFDHDGRYFQLKDLISNPKPVQSRVPIISAAMSPPGVRFAVENADFTFASFHGYDHLREHSRKLRETAKEAGNPDVGLICTSFVICRETEGEARAFHAYLRDHADLVAARNLAASSGVNVDKIPEDKQEETFRDLAMSAGSIPLIGSPEQVAEQIANLHDCGVNALFLGFQDYLVDLPFFGERVIPLLEQRGIRVPVAPSSPSEAAA